MILLYIFVVYPLAPKPSLNMRCHTTSYSCSATHLVFLGFYCPAKEIFPSLYTAISPHPSCSALPFRPQWLRLTRCPKSISASYGNLSQSKMPPSSPLSCSTNITLFPPTRSSLLSTNSICTTSALHSILSKKWRPDFFLTHSQPGVVHTGN